MGFLHRLWTVRDVVDPIVLALEARLLLGPHLPVDLHGLFELRYSLGNRREGIAIGLELLPEPARSHCELYAAIADAVKGGHHVGEERRVPESVAEDQGPNSNCTGAEGESSERREGFRLRVAGRKGHGNQ